MTYDLNQIYWLKFFVLVIRNKYDRNKCGKVISGKPQFDLCRRESIFILSEWLAVKVNQVHKMSKIGIL